MTPQDAPRSQFEQRMRLRRAATCVSSARIALETGRLLEAEERLEEACRLDPDSLEARILLEQLRSTEPDEPIEPLFTVEESSTRGARRWSHWVAVLIAVVALAALAWWRVPGPDESRITPVRQPEPSRILPQPEAPAAVELLPTDDIEVPEAPSPDEERLVLDRARSRGGAPAAPRPERGTTGQSPALSARQAMGSASPPSPRVTAASTLEASRPAQTPLVVSPPAPTTAGLPEPIDELSSAGAGSVAAPAPPSAPAPSAVDVAPASLRDAAADEEAIGQVLEQYVDAYNRLDARAARRVWPSVDERALARAFAGLESQGIAFEACDLELDGLGATANCLGRARYVPRVGDRDPINQSRRWTFRLHRVAAGWEIVNAEAR